MAIEQSCRRNFWIVITVWVGYPYDLIRRCKLCYSEHLEQFNLAFLVCVSNNFILISLPPCLKKLQIPCLLLGRLTNFEFNYMVRLCVSLYTCDKEVDLLQLWSCIPYFYSKLILMWISVSLKFTGSPHFHYCEKYEHPHRSLLRLMDEGCAGKLF